MTFPEYNKEYVIHYLLIDLLKQLIYEGYHTLILKQVIQNREKY